MDTSLVGLFAAGDTVTSESMALCLTATEHHSEVDSFVRQMAREVLEFHPNLVMCMLEFSSEKNP